MALAGITSFQEAIELAEAAYGLSRFSAASLTIFCFDYLITFDDEVEFFWKRKKSPVAVMLLFNRYLVLFGYMILFLALYNPIWDATKPLCKHFVKYEGSVATAVVIIAEILMTLRTYALYGRNKLVILGLTTIMVAQIVFSIIVIHNGGVTPTESPFNSCILAGDPSLGKWAGTMGLVPVIFDLSVLVLTVARTVKHNHGVPTMRLLLRDGVMYFFVIFSGNVAWLVSNFVGSFLYQDALAPFCTIMTAIMVQRLAINLRQTSPTAPQPSGAGSKGVGFSSMPIQFVGHDDNASQDPAQPSMASAVTRSLNV